MASPIRIKKGLDVPLSGAPTTAVTDARSAAVVSVYPSEFPGIKPRLDVKEGDTVSRGSVLFHHKQNEALKFRSPAGGTVSAVILGARRAIMEIRIDVAHDEETQNFPRYDAAKTLRLSREEALQHLQDTGFLAYIRQRPFSGIADPKATPKSIFVNAMNTAPFEADFSAAVQGHEDAFRAGLIILTRLTDGEVHLCVPEDAPPCATAAEHVAVHTFAGPHPAGNTSVHIHHFDPIAPGDVVWAVKATDVIQIGRLLLTGEIPDTKVVCVGGPGVTETARQHYRVRVGGPINDVLEGNVQDGELRIISGNVLAGVHVDFGSGFRFYDSALTVVPEGRERHFLGWLVPGLSRYSQSRLYLSRWLRAAAKWDMNTNKNGGDRAMVMTGLYDKFMPMNIMVDYLVRAVLAHDTEEAVQLGLLETDPEDFALCAFACPSKMDLVGIIRQGLKEVEEEGL